MQTDGFHYVRSKDQKAYEVPPQTIVHAVPVKPDGDVRIWKYGDDIPVQGQNYLYFYSVADLAVVMEKHEDDVESLLKLFKWRSRTWRDNRHQERQYYLFDVMVSLPGFFDGLMASWGHRIDQSLLAEARGHVIR